MCFIQFSKINLKKEITINIPKLKYSSHMNKWNVSYSFPKFITKKSVKHEHTKTMKTFSSYKQMECFVKNLC